jgi:hypothetical protein
MYSSLSGDQSAKRLNFYIINVLLLYKSHFNVEKKIRYIFIKLT